MILFSFVFTILFVMNVLFRGWEASPDVSQFN